MKMTPLIIVAIIALIPLTSQAEELIYGNCKKLTERRSVFYKCLSVDRQIVYTNVLPSPEAQKKFVKEYKKWNKKSVKLDPITLHLPSIDDIHDEKPEETLGSLKEVMKEIEPSQNERKIDPCHDEWIKGRDDMQKLGDILLKWNGVAGNAKDKEIDRLANEVGKYVTGACNI